MDSNAHDNTPVPAPDGDVPPLPYSRPVLDLHRQAPAPPRRGQPAIAWGVIVLLCTLILLRNFLLPEAAPPVNSTLPRTTQDDPLGIMGMEMQAKFTVGYAELLGGRRESRSGTRPGPSVYGQIQALNAGTIGQRQRFIVVAGEVAGPDQARTVLEDLDDLIEGALQGSDPPNYTETHRNIQAILHKLYEWSDVSPNLESLTVDERDLLIDELGWFGKLALAPPQRAEADPAARREALAPATRFAVFMLILGSVMLLAGGLGLVGLLVLIVVILIGAIRFGIGPARGSHGIYAETFAVWMALFLALQIPAGFAASFLPGFELGLATLAFFASLAALGWPVMRGIPWRDVRADIGWTLGRRPALEPVIGAGGYLMALPMLAVGIVLTLALILVQQFFSSPPSEFDPTGGPAHPVVMELLEKNWWVRVQLLVVAAVAAPIVEETFFRGVLYRHLREASRGAGIALSILISATLSSFIFAVIHPQGWVAIPALMSLAFAFVLLREWRDTIIPAMIVHGISNFLVMSMLMTALDA